MESLFSNKALHILGFIAIVILFTSISFAFYKLIFKKKPTFLEAFIEELPTAFVSFGYSSLLIFIIQQLFSDIIIKDYAYTALTLFIYIILFVWFKNYIYIFSKNIISAIREESKESLVYRNIFDTFFSINRNTNNSYLINEIIRDQERLVKNDIFLISNEGYLKILQKLINEDFRLFGINNVLPPYWFSPKKVESKIDSFKALATKHKSKTKRINYYPNSKWIENCLKETLEELKESQSFGAVKTYCWFVYLLKALKADRNALNGIEYGGFLYNESDIDKITLSYLDDEGELFKEISENTDVDSKISTIINDSTFIKSINDKVNEVFQRRYGVSSKITEEKKGTLKSIGKEWVELMLAEKGKLQIGLAVLYKVSYGLQIKLIKDTDYKTIKTEFDTNSKSENE